MLENLRDKILNVQYDLSASFRNLATGDNQANRGKKQNLKVSNAGADLLNFYQQQWKELHENDAVNANKAEEVSGVVSGLHAHCLAHLSHLRQTNVQLAALPQLHTAIMDLMTKIGELEGLFEEVEEALIHLEDVIEIQELQERQLDHRFQLAMYKEKKLADLEDMKARLSKEHEQHVQEHERQQERVLRERQDTFQKVFEEDIQEYKARGQLRKRVSSTGSANSVSLEDIELEQDKLALDEFLGEDCAENACESSKKPSFSE